TSSADACPGGGLQDVRYGLRTSSPWGGSSSGAAGERPSQGPNYRAGGVGVNPRRAGRVSQAGGRDRLNRRDLVGTAANGGMALDLGRHGRTPRAGDLELSSP